LAYYVCRAALVGFGFVQWREGAYRQGFLPFHLLFAGPVTIMAVIHYLKCAAGASVDQFQASAGDPSGPGND
jgi:hypothetical protein